ncbi:MAG: hypothetical protein ACLP50_15075 [Solirubrobacteraceae bacterium]
MTSHNDTGRQESSAMSQHQPVGAKRRCGPSRKRVLGVVVALCVPALGVGLAACGGTSSSAAATTSSTTATQASASTGLAGLAGPGGGSNARTTNAAGGSVGTVTGVSASSFTVSTPTGEKVTVKKSSSTVYDNGTRRSAASAVTKGETVLVLGKVDSTTIAAAEVIAGPAIDLAKASANVIAFKQPNDSESKSVGQIPASYKQGTGTVVSGTAATKASEAALTSYAGGIVDRVVRLSNGEYEVHYIGVNWPHHIFVTSSFKVVGAND